MTLRYSLFALAAAGFAALISCSSGTVAVAPGTGSETTNAFIGTIVYPNGTPAAHAVVRLRHQSYLADTLQTLDKTLSLSKDLLTNEAGRFSIDSLDTGSYLLEVADANGNAVVVECVTRGDSVVDLGERTLAPTSTIAGYAGGPFVRGFVRVRGLQRCATINANGRFAISVPSGKQYNVNIATADTFTEVAVNVLADRLQTININVDLGTYQTDSLALRSFLDSSLLTSVPVESVILIDSTTGRIGALHLVHQNLSVVHPSVGTLSFLNEITISNCPVTDLPSTVANLPHLYHLYLDSVPMTKLPDCVPEILSLRLLQINYTRIVTLPQALSRCTSLDVISMRGTGATQFPAVVTSMPQIRTLNISENPIALLPSSISACVKLDHLEIHDTWIDSLPSAIGELHTLREVFAYRCKIKTLPSSIGLLTSLTILNVASNQLTTLPQEIGNCLALKYLYLDNNALTALPDSIVNLAPTSTLAVGYNKLCTITAALISWLSTYAESTWSTTQTCP